MSDFIFLYRTTEAEQVAAMGTPEMAQQRMQAVAELDPRSGSQGSHQGHGPAAGSRGKVVRAGAKRVITDGPFAEAKDLVLGYTIVSARDLDQAVELSAGCPMLSGKDGSVEVRPVRNVM